MNPISNACGGNSTRRTFLGARRAASARRPWPRCCGAGVLRPRNRARTQPPRCRPALARRGASAAFPAQGQARDPSVHGGRAVASGNVRLQTQAGRAERSADARVDHQGPADRAAQGAETELLRPAARVRQATASRGRRSRRSFRTSASMADEMCIIRSMHTEAINHDPAHTFMNTGSTISGRPSMGSWLLYGLGSRKPTTCPASWC